MRATSALFVSALLGLASSLTANAVSQSSSHIAPSMNRRLRPSRSLHAGPSKRAPVSPDEQASIVALGPTDPVQGAIMAQDQDGVKNDNSGGSMGTTLIQGTSWDAADPQDNQYSWNSGVYYYPNADATPGDTEANGWVALPQLGGFSLERATIKENATMPYYVNEHDPAQIKKAVIIFAGKNRDSWKYTNLVRNALQITLEKHPEYGVTNGSILIVGPAVMNNYDVQYGAAQAQDIAWHGSQWQSGAPSRFPSTLNHSITFYEVLDYFTDWIFNTTNFPNLNGLTVAGHSMGGQAVQRYALLKKQKKYDDNIHYWVGNPGSWAWLNENRPNSNTSCADFDEWQYGLGGNQTKVTKYARKDVMANKSEIVQRYLGRNIHYGLALLDNGPGDTHCEALLQGGNHLDRGSNFIQLLGGLPGGFPKAHSVDFVAGVSHQDYAMLADNHTMKHLFQDGYTTRLPDIDPHNPSDKTKNTTNTPNPSPPPRAFATTSHKMISYGLLAGSVGAIVLIFTVLPFLFPSNSDPWEQERWEQDAKRALM